MKNSVIIFDTEEIDDKYIVPDYFSKDIAVYNIVTDMLPYLETYSISNGDKLERISYELYGTTDYWDILLMINERDPLFDMPFKYDIVEETVEKIIDTYQNETFTDAPLNQERTDILFNDRLEQAEIDNEEIRTMYVITPSLITDAISLLKTKGYI